MAHYLTLKAMQKIKKSLVAFTCPSQYQYFAVATYVIDIRNFYLVPHGCYKYMHLLEVPGKPLVNDSEYGIVIYKSPTYNQRFIRGTVAKVNADKTCDIFAIDYGISDLSVKPSAIYSPASDDVELVPPIAQLCELSHCYPRKKLEFSRDDVDTFKYYMGQHREKLTVCIKEKSGHKLSVLVTSSVSNPDDVSTIMSYINQTLLFSNTL